MKKNYVIPQMDIYRIQVSNSLLEASNLVPEDWGGGGNAGSRGFEVDEQDMLLNGNFPL